MPPLEVWFGLFTGGVGLSFSACAISCAPYLFSYILACQSHPSLSKRELFWIGMHYVLFFSLGRLFTYILIGSVAGLFYIHFFSHISQVIYPFQGIFLIFLGSIVFYSLLKKKTCLQLHTPKEKRNYLNFFILGALLGGTPCLTFFSFFPYLCLYSKNPLIGALLSCTFGLGTLVAFLPLLIVGGMMKSILKLRIISIFAATFLIFLGLKSLVQYIF